MNRGKAGPDETAGSFETPAVSRMSILQRTNHVYRIDILRMLME